MLRIAIVEDEKECQASLIEYLSRYEKEHNDNFIVRTFFDGIDINDIVKEFKNKKKGIDIRPHSCRPSSSYVKEPADKHTYDENRNDPGFPSKYPVQYYKHNRKNGDRCDKDHLGE